jgi:transcriptional regulator with XRE-family HTH domain
MLDWSIQRLADEAGLSFATVQRAERAEALSGYISTAEKLRTTLEDAGIIFIDAGPDGGPGVRLSR